MLVRFPLLDGPGNAPELLRLAVETLASLIKLPLATLVCCSMGLSRSPALAAMALARASGSDPRAQLDRVAKIRPLDVSPGLWRSLLDLDPT